MLNQVANVGEEMLTFAQTASDATTRTRIAGRDRAPAVTSPNALASPRSVFGRCG